MKHIKDPKTLARGRELYWTIEDLRKKRKTPPTSKVQFPKDREERIKKFQEWCKKTQPKPPKT